MPYTYDCDGPCGRSFTDRPPFMGEFRESFLKTDGGVFASQYQPGQTITLCAECTERVLL